MAAKEVVFSEILCFIKNNFDKLPSSQLKPVLCSFYDDDALTIAKETLHKVVQQAVDDASLLPRLPRRQGDGKMKSIVEDIFKLFTIIDESRLNDALPRFVAEDLSRVPFMNADSISVLAMARKLEAMETRFLAVEQILASSAHISSANDSTSTTDILAKIIESLEQRVTGLDTKVDNTVKSSVKSTDQPAVVHGSSHAAVQPADTHCQSSDTTGDHGEQWVSVARHGRHKSGSGARKSDASSQSSASQPPQPVRASNHSIANKKAQLTQRERATAVHV